MMSVMCAAYRYGQLGYAAELGCPLTGALASILTRAPYNPPPPPTQGTSLRRVSHVQWQPSPHLRQ